MSPRKTRKTAVADEQENKMKTYDAAFILYKHGELNTRPLTIHRDILAPNREAAWRTAQKMTLNPKEFNDEHIVRIPHSNVNLKRP